MRKLSFVVRMYISCVVFAIPIVYLIWATYKAQTVNVAFSEQEELGNQYQRPLELLLQAVSLHKLYSQRVLLHAPVAASAPQTAADLVDKGFDKLETVNERLKEPLQFTEEGLGKRKREKFNFEMMNAAWTDLKGKWSTMKPEESLAAHQDLINGLRTMIVHSGDTSNLILDPDLDSYYLMDVTLAALPQMQDHYQDVIANVEPMLLRAEKGQALSADEKVRAAVYAFMIKDTDLARVNGSADTALNEDPNFYGVSPTLKEKLPPAVAEHTERAEAFTKLLLKVSAGETVASKDFVAAGHKAMEASYKLWWVSVGELDQFLEARLDSLRADRQSSLVMATVWLLLSGLFSYYVAYTLRGSIASILRAVHSLSTAAESTGATSAQLLDRSNHVSSASSQQAAAVQETVATLHEIDAMVGTSVQSVTHSADIARKSQETAAEGKEAVGRMISSMGEINESNQNIMKAINESNRRISEITTVISGIADKTKVINDIVFQTKLLSFNASVEAARAGEHGKGFAVVAEEVGNLARMSGTAANEISQMLSDSIEKVESIVSETNRSVSGLIESGRSKVQAGEQIAKSCGDVLDNVVRDVNEMNAMMDQISSSQSEQAKGVSQISLAMQEIDSGTQQNASSASEVTSFAKDLSSRAAELVHLVKEVEREILGKSAHAKSTHASSLTESDATLDEQAA